MKKRRELTRAELDVMQILWKKERAFMGEIVEGVIQQDVEDGDNAPAYTTVATIVRILEKKDFVAHDTYGKSNQYYPIVSKEEYRTSFLDNILETLFDNSPKAISSYFAERGNLSLKEFEELRKLIENSEK